MNPVQEASLRLELQRVDATVHVGLCLVSAANGVLLPRSREFLHDSELQALARMTMPKRAGDYLRGRYAAKRAIGMLRPDAVPCTQQIGAGVFGQPVLLPPNPAGLQLSISHSGAVGIALAVGAGHPMALDIEQFQDERTSVIESVLTPDELALAASIDQPRVQTLTLMWCMKEALSKVLKCGLTTPFHVLELSAIEADAAQLSGVFRHFSQYQAIAFVLGDYGCAIALPLKTGGLPVESIRDEFQAGSLTVALRGSETSTSNSPTSGVNAREPKK